MKDGHIHSPYCPHGTSDSLKMYVEQAIELGYQSMTFTEHAPLPATFQDPVPEKDSGMKLEDLEAYLHAVDVVKNEYSGDILVQKGLEIDYIKGHESETTALLDTYGPSLDDSILSVHFLKGSQGWYCIDYSPEMFQEAVKDFGDLQQLYAAYNQCLIDSVRADLGPWKPGRIGHMTLVKKFQELYPAPEGWETLSSHVLHAVKDCAMTLDYNGAGLKKAHCKETYPPVEIARKAYAMGIPLIYGSDAHQAAALGQGLSDISTQLLTR
ncbi:histidinol-phosphatase HisJ [Halobacillus sp. BAB-2008]|uniref:histidinol-phosphatase HisJ n=1 Tax=Halobacillus sp. BAB-2008 TaxID=1246484 RepID=UPI0002A4D226|nr:histidinol-phosphatase HisJ [Halobacillus sp. BAB-2008]ELK47317.1 histidinol-phosphatase [Halobacillus sp. BAB-2008]